MTTKTSNLEAASAMMDSVPALGEDAKRLAAELYRQLACGEPVRPGSLGEALGFPIEKITALLEDEQLKGWVFYNDEGRVIGFRGLAIREMPHRFEVAGRAPYTWCALDSLFIPEMLGTSAGAEWAAQHGEGTFLVTLDEGLALGKRLNAAQFT